MWVVWSGRLANLQSAALATRLPGTPLTPVVSPSRLLVWLPVGGPASSRALSDTPPAACSS